MRSVSAAILFLVITSTAKPQYISEVLEYVPGPGQHINTLSWGSPFAAESILGTNQGSLCLGSFGGYVIFTFEEPVENHPDNPFGVDFTIFGNPMPDWSEPGIVSVMKDENENGQPDDTWYELAGSEYFFSTTTKGYEITYTNPGGTTASEVPWTDNQGNSGMIPANPYHTQTYYPLLDSFPTVTQDTYTLTGTRVATHLDLSSPAWARSYRKSFGYADNQLRGSAPFTVPDNPYTPEKENSGGDAFDISWAVNASGEYVQLDQIHFIKVHNAVLDDSGWLGELSTEITGALDVPPDPSITGVSEMIGIMPLPDTIRGSSFQLEVVAFENGIRNPDAGFTWKTNLPDATINNDQMLSFSSSGTLVFTVNLINNPQISASDSVVLVHSHPSHSAEFTRPRIRCYPNPANHSLFIEGVKDADVRIISVSGERIAHIRRYNGLHPIPVAHLNSGIYLLRISEASGTSTARFIKE